MKTFLIACSLTITAFASAQMKEGRVVYERTMQLPTRMIRNDGGDVPQMPRSRTDQFELLFSANHSLYQFLPNANDENPGEISGGGIVMRFGGLNDIIYHNFDKSERIDKRNVLDRDFIVADSIRKLNWKLTDETKTILNYTARKATAQNIRTAMRMSMENGEMKREPYQDTSNVVAWFTSDVPIPAGPDFQAQLPGLILELSVNNGQQVYRAIEVSPKVSVSKIKPPKDGKKLTAAEFAKERDALMEEMRKNMPAGNTIRINQ
jgi:GLPGLI family protein